MKPVTQDDIDRELQQLLTVEPSRNFVAQVRNAVANQPTRSGGPAIFVALALSVAAVVLVAVAVYFTGPSVDQTIASTPHQTEEGDKTPTPDAVPTSTSPPAEAIPKVRVRSNGSRAQRAAPEPWLQVIVSPDDREAFERLVRGTEDGIVALSFEETNHKLTSAELTIAPITTEPLFISEQQGVVQ